MDLEGPPGPGGEPQGPLPPPSLFNGQGQRIVFVSGTVSEKHNKKPLRDATIIIGDTMATTDVIGRFSIEVAATTRHVLKVNHERAVKLIEKKLTVLDKSLRVAIHLEVFPAPDSPEPVRTTPPLVQFDEEPEVLEFEMPTVGMIPVSPGGEDLYGWTSAEEEARNRAQAEMGQLSGGDGETSLDGVMGILHAVLVGGVSKEDEEMAMLDGRTCMAQLRGEGKMMEASAIQELLLAVDELREQRGDVGPPASMDVVVPAGGVSMDALKQVADNLEAALLGELPQEHEERAIGDAITLRGDLLADGRFHEAEALQSMLEAMGVTFEDCTSEEPSPAIWGNQLGAPERPAEESRGFPSPVTMGSQGVTMGSQEDARPKPIITETSPLKPAEAPPARSPQAEMAEPQAAQKSAEGPSDMMELVVEMLADVQAKNEAAARREHEKLMIVVEAKSEETFKRCMAGVQERIDASEARTVEHLKLLQQQQVQHLGEQMRQGMGELAQELHGRIGELTDRFDELESQTASRGVAPATSPAVIQDLKDHIARLEQVVNNTENSAAEAARLAHAALQSHELQSPGSPKMSAQQRAQNQTLELRLEAALEAHEGRLQAMEAVLNGLVQDTAQSARAKGPAGGENNSELGIVKSELVRHKTKLAQQDKKFSEALAEQGRQLARAETRLREISMAASSATPSTLYSSGAAASALRSASAAPAAPVEPPPPVSAPAPQTRPGTAPTTTRRPSEEQPSSPARSPGRITHSMPVTPTAQGSLQRGEEGTAGKEGGPSSPSLDSRVEERLKQWESAIEKRLARLGLRPPTPSPAKGGAVARSSVGAVQSASSAGALYPGSQQAAAAAAQAGRQPGGGSGTLEDQVQSHVSLLREAHRLALRQAIDTPEGGHSSLSPEQVTAYSNPSFSPAAVPFGISGGPHELQDSPPRKFHDTTSNSQWTPSVVSPFSKHVQALLARDVTA